MPGRLSHHRRLIHRKCQLKLHPTCHRSQFRPCCLWSRQCQSRHPWRRQPSPLPSHLRRSLPRPFESHQRQTPPRNHSHVPRKNRKLRLLPLRLMASGACCPGNIQLCRPFPARAAWKPLADGSATEWQLWRMDDGSGSFGVLFASPPTAEPCCFCSGTEKKRRNLSASRHCVLDRCREFRQPSNGTLISSLQSARCRSFRCSSTKSARPYSRRECEEGPRRWSASAREVTRQSFVATREAFYK